ncbi:MAG TPA: Zn-ribbon domain-containing OB-fold protein [Trebonia sp.]|jgi:uncharacterized protein
MTDQPYNKPIPRLDDPDQGPFWAAAREHRLTAQKCTNCGALRYPALQICPTCWERGFEWVDVSTEGTIWSYVVYHRAFHPGFASELPYVVAIVENTDGVRYTGRVIGRREDVAVGAKVRAVFADETQEFTLVKWELA